jgi:hypothetical protein
MKKSGKNKKHPKTAPAHVPENRGQALPTVLMLAALLTILATALLTLLRFESKFLVKTTCITQKQELANLALEHTLFKIQQGSNWFSIPPQFNGYTHEFSAIDPQGNTIGTYTVHITNGNMFMNVASNPIVDTNPSAREAQSENKTVGIKVKTAVTGCVGDYYAVIQRAALGGPLVSKGSIALPCIDAKINDMNFYWGDIYSDNAVAGNCRIPQVNVAQFPSNGNRSEWLPSVYSLSDVYTAVGYTSGGRSGAYQYAATYDDMSPTAHCHPYSEFAIVPDMDMEALKSLANYQGSYYGPQIIPGAIAGATPTTNKYYINDGSHNIANVTQANVVTIMSKLRTTASVLFIDTTDGLPIRNTNPTNTYSGLSMVPANYIGDKTLRFYVNETNQYMTAGTCVIQGPLELIGYNPSSITAAGMNGFSWGYGNFIGSNADDILNIPHMDNYYWPQETDNLHYVRNLADDTQSKLTNVKHYGTLYCGGELRIGGPHAGTTVSNICIYGTIYIGPAGMLTVESNATYDNPTLYVYYNKNMSLFGMQGASLQVLSFGELTFLVPTVGPTYPTAFTN